MREEASVRGGAAVRAGLDAAALKPAACEASRAAALPLDTLVFDYEGREHVPDAATLRTLAEDREVRVTVPVRADGFDPLGADDRLRALPDAVGRVFVAGHEAYLGDHETARSVAPRLGAAVEDAADPWVGTEGVERVALATGATQFLLLSGTTADEVRALRAAGFAGDVAVYAPTALTADEAAILDAVGDYVARRRPVADALPEGARTDGSATGRAREVLSAAARDYALVGDAGTVRDRVADLRTAGVDHVVGHPARGLDAFLG